MASETPLLPILREAIRAAGGKIPFARFMEMCLYHPQYGYYNTERVKLGKHGDYYTSAHTGPVFARLFARHFELLWHELRRPARFDLVELGPGDGWFAAELLPWIAKRFPEFSSHLHYTAAEQSPVQRARVTEKLAAFGDRAQIVDNFPSGTRADGDGVVGCIFANEFFDALPIHILVWRQGRWLERYVYLEGNDLAWHENEVSSPYLVERAQRTFGQESKPGLSFGLKHPFAEPEEGQPAEVSHLASHWMGRIANSVKYGDLMIVDYGYTANEWKAGRFPQGSALGYCQHREVENLLANLGEQDLTAHVNFSQLIEIASQNGLQQSGLMQSQAKFLMELGEADEFHDVFADCATDLERQQRAQQLKTLILPQGMGETFRVLQFRKR